MVDDDDDDNAESNGSSVVDVSYPGPGLVTTTISMKNFHITKSAVKVVNGQPIVDWHTRCHLDSCGDGLGDDIQRDSVKR